LKPGVTVTKDETKKVLAAIRKLAEERVLVGVPDKTADRKNEDAEISNALIGYINEFGSPAQNIPARPHLVIGVQNSLEKIVGTYKGAAKATLNGNPAAIEQAHARVGLIAQSSVRSKITGGPFQSLSPVTIANRKARGRTGTKPLIDTGQYRNSISFVIRKG
jgi:hypothetical protein